MPRPAPSTTRARSFPTRIDLPEEERMRSVALLNRALAGSTDLYTQTKHAHWNVKGPTFFMLHKLFDELAEMTEGHVDLLAERITALGGTALGTARLVASNSPLEEFPRELTEDTAFVEALADRYAAHAAALRGGIDEEDERGDKATADVLTEIVRDLDQALYFLEAHLRGQGR